MNHFFIYIIAIISFGISIVGVEFIRNFYRKQLTRASLKSVTKIHKKMNTRLVDDISRLTNSRWGKVFEALTKLSLPSDEGWQDSNIKLKFIRAGYRDSRTIFIFYGLKTILFIFLPLIVGILTSIFSSSIETAELFIYIFFLAMIGYFLPELFLRFKTIQPRLNNTFMINNEQVTKDQVFT